MSLAKVLARGQVTLPRSTGGAIDAAAYQRTVPALVVEVRPDVRTLAVQGVD